MIRSLDVLLDTVDNDQPRADVNNNLRTRLTRRSSQEEQREVQERALLSFPELVERCFNLSGDTGTRPWRSAETRASPRNSY